MMNSASGIITSPLTRLVILFIFALTSKTVVANPDDVYWDGGFSIAGVNGQILAITKDETNGDVYIAGTFPTIGDQVINGIARWDGSQWNTLGAGLNPYGSLQSLSVRAMAFDPAGNLIVGGQFSGPNGSSGMNGLAMWDGTGWSAVGPGVSYADIHAIVLDNNADLVVAGNLDAFTSSGVGVGRWDGSNWQQFGDGFIGAGALAVDGQNNIYVGGFFTAANGFPHGDYITRWDGSTFSSVGNGVSGTVRSIVIGAADELLIGGFFTDAGGDTNADGLAQLAGSQWTAVGGSHPFNWTYSVGQFSNGDLIATDSSKLYQWDGNNWQQFGSANAGGDNEIHVDANDSVFFAGYYTEINSVLAQRIAQWDGTNWSAVGNSTGGNGLSQTVFALSFLPNGDLFAGGNFGTIDGVPNSKGMAIWDGSNWNSIGELNGTVHDSDVDANGNLIIAGFITSIGSQTINRIAMYDGNSWTGFGSGTTGNIYAVASSDVGGSKVYAGGEFTTLGGTSISNIGVWDGATWMPLGDGLNGIVNGLVVAGNGDLYAGGWFTDAGGDADADYVARWDGTTWSSLGASYFTSPFSVRALAIDLDGNLLVGGYFNGLGGDPNARGMVKWDGADWSTLGGGVDSSEDISIDSFGNIYTANSSANEGQVFDGTSWKKLGSGITANQSVAAGPDGQVYFGGNFSIAGDKPSNRIAKWQKLVCNGLPITVDMNKGETTTPDDDVVLGTPGPDVIRGKAGNDTICGMGGDDFIHGNSGDDWIDGGIGVDNLRGGRGSDTIYTGLGATVGTSSRAFGGYDNDFIYGGPDDDDLRGGSGEDTIIGDDGNDEITGNGDDDIIHGNGGDDILKGGNGENDELFGGPGDDSLNGGAGNGDLCDSGGDAGDTQTNCEI